MSFSSLLIHLETDTADTARVLPQKWSEPHFIERKQCKHEAICKSFKCCSITAAYNGHNYSQGPNNPLKRDKLAVCPHSTYTVRAAMKAKHSVLTWIHISVTSRVWDAGSRRVWRLYHPRRAFKSVIGKTIRCHLPGRSLTWAPRITHLESILFPWLELTGCPRGFSRPPRHSQRSHSRGMAF